MKIWKISRYAIYLVDILLLDICLLSCELVKEDKKRKKRVGAKEEAKMAMVKGEKVKKERKVYELPGQKHDPPTEV